MCDKHKGGGVQSQVKRTKPQGLENVPQDNTRGGEEIQGYPIDTWLRTAPKTQLIIWPKSY